MKTWSPSRLSVKVSRISHSVKGMCTHACTHTNRPCVHTLECGWEKRHRHSLLWSIHLTAFIYLFIFLLTTNSFHSNLLKEVKKKIHSYRKAKQEQNFFQPHVLPLTVSFLWAPLQTNTHTHNYHQKPPHTVSLLHILLSWVLESCPHDIN